MADYNRFVSYIYLYENGEKTINAGFARVESRNGQCRVNITMRNMYNDPGSVFKAYMFVRKNKRLVGIYIGDMKTENHNGEYSGTTSADDIESSGYGLDDVSGLIITDDDKIYGTRWDDESLEAETFVKLEDYDEPQEKEEVTDKITDINTVRETAEAYQHESEQRLEVIGAGLDQDEQVMTEDEVEDAQVESESLEAVADETIAPIKIRYIHQPEQHQEPLADAENMTDDPIVSFDHVDGYGMNTEQIEELFSKERADEAENAGEMPEGNPVPLYSFTTPSTNKEKSEQTQVSVWTRAMDNVMDKGLRMYPFEDNDIIECVRLEPQDIGMLPMKCWVYGNNSFLLHGYYSYRHLILAKTQSGRYLLGVPGINHNRETFMANMFGFKKFKSIRNNSTETCEFGYWYVELN